MVEYVVHICAEVDALPFGELYVLAQRHIERPPSRTDQLVGQVIAPVARCRMLEDDYGRVACKSQSAEVGVAGSPQAGGNTGIPSDVGALRIRHRHVLAAVEAAARSSVDPGKIPAFGV